MKSLPDELQMPTNVLAQSRANVSRHLAHGMHTENASYGQAWALVLGVGLMFGLILALLTMLI